MPTELRLLTPVTGASVLVASAWVQYTEIDGTGVLGDLQKRAVHELSPAAAVMWSLIDGERDLDAIAATPSVHDLATGELVELVRRLRAIGVVGDRDPARATSEGVRPSPNASNRAVAFHVWPGVSDQPTRTVVLVPAGHLNGTSTTEVHVDTHGAAATDAGPIDRIELIDADSPPRRLEPAAALSQLVRALVTDDLPATGTLDLLADLAERVPLTIRAASTSPVD